MLRTEAKAMGDEYVSVEHLFLCLLKYPNKAMKELIKGMVSQETDSSQRFLR